MRLSTRSARRASLFTLGLVLTAAGCELAVDFDRTKIDAGSVDGSIADVVVGDAPSGTDSGKDAQGDAPSDAPVDAPGDSPGTDGGDGSAPDGDAAVDAPEDAPADADDAG